MKNRTAAVAWHLSQLAVAKSSSGEVLSVSTVSGGCDLLPSCMTHFSRFLQWFVITVCLFRWWIWTLLLQLLWRAATTWAGVAFEGSGQCKCCSAAQKILHRVAHCEQQRLNTCHLDLDSSGSEPDFVAHKQAQRGSTSCLDMKARVSNSFLSCVNLCIEALSSLSYPFPDFRSGVSPLRTREKCLLRHILVESCMKTTFPDNVGSRLNRLAAFYRQ